MSTSDEITVAKPTPTQVAKAPAPGPEMDNLLKKAAKGDRSCLPEINALLADGQRGRLITNYNGSSAEWLRQTIAKKASGGDLLVVESIKKKLEMVQAELEGPNPTPIERLLAERASLCWFVVNWYEDTVHQHNRHEHHASRLFSTPNSPDSPTIPLGRGDLGPGPQDGLAVPHGEHRQEPTSQRRGDPRMSERNGSLSPDQLRAVGVLAGADPADVAGCDPEAVAGWLDREPEFIAGLNQAKSYRRERLRAEIRSLTSGR